MDAIQVLAVLFGASAGLFLLISALVVLPGRLRASAARATSAGAVWFGGPSRSERDAGVSGPVLVDPPPPAERAPRVDWVALAEVSEPGRRVGGASARW
ncbi:hypothetical protein [Streptosporangium carneum]|uniref:Uncharacterized protein n=1 Tax=Streptosporangium carneum TaxID=47481 RepID=A0A9W6I7N4_9ACTN|nr:hypothetical protein [Streptosporangium carneum]GLK12454.1 hypothetical protein GCM10017600_58640 [Streptosporangium carneum]